MNIAVLLAGGKGRRMGGDLPKQFLLLSGRTVLEHALRAFHSHPDIDAILVVSHADYVEQVQEITRAYPKVRGIVTGGKERSDSSLAAIEAAQRLAAGEATESHILLHDAARPLVTARIITDCLQALQTFEAVDVAVPCTDTIAEVDDEGNLLRIPPRASMRAIQTPQGFHLSTLSRAYQLAMQDPDFQATDDCGVVFHYLPHIPIYVVAGDTNNFKITYPSDIPPAAKILEDRGSL